MPPDVRRDSPPSPSPGPLGRPGSCFKGKGQRRGTTFHFALFKGGSCAPRQHGPPRGGGGEAWVAVAQVDDLPGKGETGLLPRGHWWARFENNPRAPLTCSARIGGARGRGGRGREGSKAATGTAVQNWELSLRFLLLLWKTNTV